ncbi:G-protein coupled receptor Mth2-like [Maniola jurtina]|uniref:G-protein coupled receptor Mth2-like n=1 Tax=Maniola jurtina TaxID=191418 RepID=UPI001E68C6DF|nr:G-protein coupled receptor Mth2-like [Maniola jurtina]
MMCCKIFLVFFIIVLVSRTICAFSMILGPGDNKTAKCLERKCIPKCCEIGKYLNLSLNECYDYGQDYDFQNVPVYDAFTSNTLVLNQLKNATMGDIFYLVPGKMYEVIPANNLTFVENFPFRSELYGLISYLTETGEMYMEFPNAYSRWTRVEDFCVDYVVTDETTGDVEVYNLLVMASTEEVGVQSYYYYYLITSCVFLILVLLVYMILPELRNLGGMILMAYTSSLLMGFILLAVMQSGDIVKCIELTASIYFFLLATFCWMSVMSVDIWWTFRGYAKARPIHRRGESFKFCMYCLYGWGLPGVMTIGLVVVNEADLSHMPWIIKPLIPKGGCFLQEGQKLVYLYIPLLFLILSNWLFFLMTAYNIRRLMRGTAVLNTAAAGNPAAHQQQRNRLMVYLKLSVIMGINWLLEVVSFFTPKLRVWEVSDTYNLLIGFAIFLIFVCKKKIYKKLVARFYELRSSWFGGKRPTRTLTKSSTSSSTLESNLSQDIPLQVSNNPMPEDKRGRKNCNVFSFNRTNYKINTDLK